MTIHRTIGGIYIYIYIFFYNLQKNYQPSFCIANTMLSLLFRQVRIPYLKDCQNQTHISRERPRQVDQVRREHTVNGNTVLMHS